jgi:chaperone required for assembly of F1-ATPase
MKKYYESVSCRKIDEGFAVFLDAAPARTALGLPVAAPTQALGEAIAQEWQAQGDVIRKETMPLTQLASMAVDLSGHRGAMMADILAYGDTDLICYRAGDAPGLNEQQALKLDPVIGWVEERFGIALKITDGVMPVKQPPENRMKLMAAISDFDDWQLAALAAAVKALGSLVLALAFMEGHVNGETAFALSHLEEEYETNDWGKDEEKEKRLRHLKGEIEAVERFKLLLGVG